jgi:transposase
MQNKIFEAALGIANPWYIKGVEFDAEQKSLSIHIDFIAGSRFAYPGVEGVCILSTIRRSNVTGI